MKRILLPLLIALGFLIPVLVSAQFQQAVPVVLGGTGLLYTSTGFKAGAVLIGNGKNAIATTTLRSSDSSLTVSGGDLIINTVHQNTWSDTQLFSNGITILGGSIVVGSLGENISASGGNLYLNNIAAFADLAGNITAPSFIGDGSALTNLPAGHITGTLGVTHGGTGQTSFTSSRLLYGAGTNPIQSVATGTIGVSGGITATANQYIIGSGLTIGCTAAGSGSTGCLSSTDWNTFNNKQATISSTFPIALTGAALSFTGLSTSSAAVTGNIPYFSGVNTFANVATSSGQCSGFISCSAFKVIGSVSPTITTTGQLGVASGGTGSSTLSGILIGNGTGGVQTVNIGTNLTLTGTTLSASGGGSSQWTTSGSNIYYPNPISGVGNVGIGSSTPFANLSIAGLSNQTTPLFEISSSTSGVSRNVFIVDSNGNVGINTGNNNLTNALTVQNTTDVRIDMVNVGVGFAGYRMTAGSFNWFMDNRGDKDTPNNRLAFSTSNDGELFTILSGSGNVGIGTTSPTATLSVQPSVNPVVSDIFIVATSSGATVSGIDSDGHPFTSGPAPAISSCGTGTGTVVGDDLSGTITTATAATACTMTFSQVFQKAPTCRVTDNSLVGFADVSSVSTSAVTFGISSALTGGKLYYDCKYHR